jgi:hypothetical protein
MVVREDDKQHLITTRKDQQEDARRIRGTHSQEREIGSPMRMPPDWLAYGTDISQPENCVEEGPASGMDFAMPLTAVV